MKEISIETINPYKVLIGGGLLGKTASLALSVNAKCKKAAIISDDNVFPLYGKAVEDSFKAQGIPVISYVLKNGEKSKNIENALDIIKFLSENEVTRTDIVIALGGGVVGDITGFVSSVYLRGISFIAVPTTYLAAIDSSVGGKTAVNSSFGKNLIGTFYQPAAVICDTGTRATLTPEVFAEGTAEAIKYGCLEGGNLLELIEAGDRHYEEIVTRCVNAKKRIVQNDEFDTGERQLLNLGHTIAHAIEKLSGFETSHGKAVGIGLYLICKAGERNGITEPGTAEKLGDLLVKNGLAVDTPYSMSDIAEVCLHDKKRSGDFINLIVPKSIGSVQIVPVNKNELLSFLGG